MEECGRRKEEKGGGKRKEGGRRKGEGRGRRKEEGGRRKEEGGRRKEEVEICYIPQSVRLSAHCASAEVSPHQSCFLLLSDAEE